MASGADSQRPPYCPNPRCEFHANPRGWRYARKGFFVRLRDPRRIQRYRCSRCGRSFSTQTFSTSYWLKRRDLLRPIFFRIVGCGGLRQIAREFGASHSTIQRQVERLGRHCLLFHERRRPRRPREPLVLDGFRTLEGGHYWPFDLNLLVGESHYVYGFNDAELRRGGAMRPGQRRHRRRLERRHGRPDPRATRQAVAELVGRVVPPGGRLELRCDEHKSYPPAIRGLRGRRIELARTSSREARTSDNPLFPVNLADLLLRHSSANHKRETIAFSKRRQGALYRAAIWTVWRNYLKSTSENRGSPPPGVAIGAVARRWRVEQVLAERLFPSRVGIRGWLRRCYEGRIPTRRLRVNRWHEAKLAY